MLGFVGQGVVESVLLEPAASAQILSRVSLKLRKGPKYIDVMLTSMGDSARVVQEKSSDTSWLGKVVRSGDSLSAQEAPQQVAMPKMGLALARLRKSGSTYELEVKSVDGAVLPKPKIFTAGGDLVLRFSGLEGASVARQSGSLDSGPRTPNSQGLSAPRLMPQAFAPPVGDIAVGSMLVSNPAFVQASGPPVTLTLKNAQAKDALLSLARLGGYGFVYVGSSSGRGQRDSESLVTMSFREESYDRALNSLLIASGLQGKLVGGTLFVGGELASQSVGPQLSKVFRLNQIQSDKAADYLANLGALIYVTDTKTTSAEESSNTSSGSSSTSFDRTNSYGATQGPLLGLVGTTDSRLGTITLIGEPKLISVAETYLRQIDLRKRQVAVKVQILNVELDNSDFSGSSFSARIGDLFVVSDGGNAFINFGDNKPGGFSGTGLYEQGASGVPGTYPSSAVTNIYSQPNASFYAYLESQLYESDAQTLAQPTLMVQEGEKATVETGEEVVVNITRNDNGDTGTTSFTFEKETAGLVLELNVSKIDDNGFVTMDVNPSVSIPVPAPGTTGASGAQIFNLNKRELKSGTIRLRDGQTLILTGVVSERQLEAVRKWPILGDLPLLGNLFRQSSTSRNMSELVILVTPRVLDDEQNGGAGTGYRAASEATRNLLQGGQ